MPQIDLLANTSAVGLKGELRFRALSLPACWFDMVYSSVGRLFAPPRPWCRSADGLGMLAAQGENLLLWTGQRPPDGVMMARLLANARQLKSLP
jgi:shikimate 5-dehydrogenase